MLSLSNKKIHCEAALKVKFQDKINITASLALETKILKCLVISASLFAYSFITQNEKRRPWLHGYFIPNKSQLDHILHKTLDLLINTKYYKINLNPYFFKFGALIIPATDLIIPSEHLHRHHADSESHCSHNDFPWMGGYKKAMHSEESGQHFQGWFSTLSKPATKNIVCKYKIRWKRTEVYTSLQDILQEIKAKPFKSEMSKEIHIYLSFNLPHKTHLFLIHQNTAWSAPVFSIFFFFFGNTHLPGFFTVFATGIRSSIRAWC